MDNFSQATSKLAQSQSLYPRLSFITFGDVEDSRNRISRKAVRSHAALYQHAASRESKGLNESTAKKKQIRRYKKQDVVLDIEILTTIPSEETSGFPEESPRNSLKGTSLQVILGQGRCDPFRTYPIDWNPRIPQLVDHYLTNMAIDMPELDEPGNAGLLRTRWFPLTMTSAPIFHVIILLAASHHSALYSPTKEPSSSLSRTTSRDLIHLKSIAIASINRAMQADSLSTSDPLIGAVAKMASYEAMYGDVATFEVHMKGLIQMVRLRGGLGSLGLSGLLAKICVWIDCNAAFVHGMDHTYFEPEGGRSWLGREVGINPSGFLAAY
ncbi:hypothetical protein BKA61DRAFT_661373 [Leptodontidium sp. MPI-SDFR-AT-0119]|nr:hypothetical protein BKA61DRAFT_661373 [Leptodontidium sp. MPI-SDFR-AT-0119]